MTLQTVESQSYAISSAWVNPPGNAFDGGLATNWATSTATINYQSGVDWIGQDFGSAKAIVQITFEQMSSATALTSVRVQHSDNSTVWTDVGTYTVPKSTALNTFTFSAGSHRYWRLLANANVGNNERWQVTRIRMYVEEAVVVGEPHFTAYPEQALSITANSSKNARGIANATTIVPCNVVWNDNTAAYSTTLYRFTPQKPGRYEFKAFLQVDGNVTGPIHIHICKNGDPFVFPKFPALAGCWGYAVEIPLNGTTDYVDVRVQVEGGTGLKIGCDYGDWSWFEGHYLGD